MKKLIFNVMLAFCGILLFNSCNNNDDRLRKEIVGTWSYSDSEENEEDGIITIVSANGTSTFKSNGTCKDDGIFTITYINDEGGQSNLKYKFDVKGKYEIQDSYIIYDYNPEDVNIKLLESDNYNLSNLFAEHYIPQLKRTIIESEDDKILELTGKRMKIESDDNEPIVYFREK
jgi:hypothetical protein